MSVSTWVAIIAVTLALGVTEGAYRRVRALRATQDELEHALWHVSTCKDGCPECARLATEALASAEACR